MIHDKSKRKIIKKIRSSDNLSVRKGILVNSLLVIVFVCFIFPIIWILIMSFKEQSQIASMPPDVFSSFTLNNYRNIFNIGAVSSDAAKNALMHIKAIAFFKSILNTILLSTSSVLISLLIGVPAAYGLSRYKNKNKESLAFIFLSFRFVPELIIIIPLYLIYQKMNLYGTYFGLIWVYILISLPMIIWITRSYFDDLPFDLEQAAMLDGYSKWRVFFKVILPLAKPGIAAATVLSFIYAWNSFIFGFVLATSRIQPVTVMILSFYDITDLNYGRMAASIIIAILPMIIVSQIASKYLISGLSMGAIKK
ncbi:MAG: carbohydrate ABC transporter permease [Actinobacteria bacterium]|nr:carbohydrate ABC transporter permease [Actinomycetota bacterium]